MYSWICVGPSLLDGRRVFVTIGAVELFWIVSEWPNGPEALGFATIAVILFAQRAAPYVDRISKGAKKGLGDSGSQSPASSDCGPLLLARSALCSAKDPIIDDPMLATYSARVTRPVR
jgi:hypothetical protein